MNKIITPNGVIDIIIPLDAKKNGTGEYYMICPICTSSRKAEHQKETKFAINLQKDPMPWRCNHCGKGGYVITEEYMKRAKFKPIITKMDFLDLTDSMVTWFWEQRKISIKTLRDKKISMSLESIKQTRVTPENEHQKDKWVERKCINFKYFKDNILINVKFRDANKNFKMIMDATRTIYNIDSFKGKKKGIFVEGECFTGETEVLTRNGWLRFDLYNGEEIMQASSNYPIKGKFVKPSAIIRKDFSGLLVELKSKNYYSLTTPEHNIITQTNNEIENQKRKAINVYSTKSINGAIPITVQANNDLEGIALSDDQIRFCVAVSADMTIREEGDIYSAFKKERKIKRMISMLDRMHLRYSNKIDGHGRNSIFIHRNQGLDYVFKYFPHNWIGKLNNHQIGIILEELLFWDGNSVPRRTQIEYATIWYENAIFIQTLCHMKGMASSIIRRKNKIGSWYKISLLKKNHVSLQCCLKRKLIPYEGQVYCVNVPSGAILIRHNEKISVSGNCDVLAYCEAGLEKEYGIGSVPNGATITAEERKRFEETGNMDVLSEINLEYLDLVIDELNHIEEFYIATDDDPPGIKLREELARRLGRERCKYIRFSDYKNSKGKPVNDPNELLIEKGANVLAGTIDTAIPYPISGVSTASQYWDVMKGFYDTGKPRGISTGYTGLDPHFSWMFGWLTILNGFPNSGKTGFALNMIAISIVLYKWKWGIYCPENYPVYNVLDVLAEILVGKSLDVDASNRMCKEEYDDVVNNYINKYVYIVDDNEDGYSPADIRKIKKSMVKQYGIVGFFTDPWSSLVHNYKSADSEDKYLEHQLSLEVRLTTKLNIINLISHHPKTPVSVEKAPSVFTLTGGKVWWIKAFAIFAIHRRNVNDWQNLITEFHVQKQKDFKAAGELTNESNCPTFKFDRKSRRFLERKDSTDLNGVYDQYPFEIYQETNQLLFEGF